MSNGPRDRLLIGEPGAGKTFALRALKESLNPSLYHVVYGLALGLGEEPKYRKVDLFHQIQQAMSDYIMNGGARSC